MGGNVHQNLLTLALVLAFITGKCDGQHPATRPLNIAHRGSSGALPEHTAEAYRLAVEQGADVIECDVCVTKDLQLICRHESWLNETTNVWFNETLKVKRRTRFIIDSNRNITDIFTVDLTLAEIKTIRARQKYEFRNQNLNDQYQIPTLKEYINIAKTAGRNVGIYPEVKDPKWVNSLDIITSANTTFEDLVVDLLHENGYISKDSPCYVQSFSEESIRTLSTKTQLALVMLMDTDFPTDDGKLKNLSEICYGIGPYKNMIIPVGNNYIQSGTNLIARAHKFNLKVHPYTYRNEDRYLAWNYTQDPYNEYQTFLDAQVDGYFTDFPASLKQFLDDRYIRPTSSPCRPINSARGERNGISYMLLFVILIVFTLV